MTEIVWGSPLPCRYSWVEPGLLADYADSLHHTGRKVEEVRQALEALAVTPEAIFAGETAESLRVHADRRAHDATSLRGRLQDLGEALRAHAGVLGRYRDALAALRRLATTRGLDVRDGLVWAPPGAPPDGATPQQHDAWVAAWKAYRACFELKGEIEQERRERSHDLARAVTASTGERPDPEGGGGRTGGRGIVRFGPQDEDEATPGGAAERARRTLEAHEAVEASLARVSRLRHDHRAALDELRRLGRAEAAEVELTAQAREVRLAAEVLRSARQEAARLQTGVAVRIS